MIGISYSLNFTLLDKNFPSTSPWSKFVLYVPLPTIYRSKASTQHVFLFYIPALISNIKTNLKTAQTPLSIYQIIIV